MKTGAGAAKTGSSLIRRGSEGDDDSSLAKTEGRNVDDVLSEFCWAEALAETEAKHQPLMEAVDIVPMVLSVVWLYTYVPNPPLPFPL